jgi:hypothetical protein
MKEKGRDFIRKCSLKIWILCKVENKVREIILQIPEKKSNQGIWYMAVNVLRWELE